VGLAVLLGVGFLLFWAWLVAITLDALLRPSRRTLAWCLARGEPSDPSEADPARGFEEGEVVEPRPPHARCPLWRIEGDEPSGPVLVFCHGWGESRQAVLQRLHALAPVCSAIVSWDLPGHGEASPGIARLGASEHLALSALLESLGRERPVVLMGFSMGAGVCLRAAAEEPDRVAGVIAEAPYRLPWTPARNVMHLKGFPHRLNLRPALGLAGVRLGVGPSWRGFDRASLAAGLRCPLLVLHAPEDEMCPIEDGRAIAEATPDGRLEVVPGASHLTMWSEKPTSEAAAGAVRAFLSRLL
jgi:pimeloyl-ACP methyl ester carboxylesterase